MCSSLVSITIPDGVQRIDYETFQRCTALESVKFPAGLTAIGDYAFGNCTSLTSVALPRGGGGDCVLGLCRVHLADLGGPSPGPDKDWERCLSRLRLLTSVNLPPG